MEGKKQKVVGEGVKFERIRRVTGYLSGTVDRFNNGKRAEEKDRVKHSGIKEVMAEVKKIVAMYFEFSSHLSILIT